jgi:CspA family cold shock protein
MTLGTVKWFDPERGYGFIAPDDEADVFVHYSDVEAGSLLPNERVQFEIEESDKGPRAIGVSLYGEEQINATN